MVLRVTPDSVFRKPYIGMRFKPIDDEQSMQMPFSLYTSLAYFICMFMFFVCVFGFLEATTSGI